MTKEISNSDDVIDSRDVIKRIEELQGERADLKEAADQADADYLATVDVGGPDERKDEAALLETWDGEFGEELKALKSLADDAAGYCSDWKYGAGLIRDSYFTEHAEELCKDIGDMPREIPHYIAIDWERTAENIKQDYTAVEYGDVTYWVR